jgi:hypothetical protein
LCPGSGPPPARWTGRKGYDKPKERLSWERDGYLPKILKNEQFIFTHYFFVITITISGFPIKFFQN